MSRLDLDGFEKSDKIFAMVPYHILPPSGNTPNSAHIYGLALGFLLVAVSLIGLSLSGNHPEHSDLP